MRHTSRTCAAIVAGLLLFVAESMVVFAQSTSQSGSKLPIKAALILTPEFCASKITNGEQFEVGRSACSELEPALKGVFASLTVMPEVPKTGDVKIILIPGFAGAGATRARIAFSDRELNVFLQWTVKDMSGKTLWIGTAQGSAKHHMGNTFTYKKNLRLIVNDAVKDLASQSANKISASPELRTFAQ